MSKEEDPGPLSGKTLVVVEDDSVELKRYSKILEKLGAKVLKMDSPEALIEASAGMKLPALVLADICGPGKIDGIGLMARLQHQPSWCRVPVIMMTASPTAERVSRASQLPVPAIAFMAKPVPAQKLSDLVVEALSDRSPLYLHRRLMRDRTALGLEVAQKQATLERALEKLTKTIEKRDRSRVLAKERHRGLTDALNRATSLSPELAVGLRSESKESSLDLDVLNNEINKLDSDRTRLSNEKKRHAFQSGRELESLDEQVHSAACLLKIPPRRNAA